ncbi:MAG: potassium transporter TrkA, partial [Bacteroidetes bacterium]|nr:potassium transporter TrkA [Bacteroidota bacterium]
MTTANYLEILVYLAGFLIIAVASRHIANSFINYKLPLITGLLITGIITGPFVLQLIPEQSIVKLNFVNETALA